MAGGSRRKRTGQRKNKKSFARQSAKEHSLSHPQNESSLSDELTALSSIFQEDFTLISEDSFTEFSIALRPHADADGSNVYAELHVRCLPGYPNKPPKLQIKCEKGLSTEDVHSLHSLLVDQATSVSREGRVMIYNLVETATEFLSEHNESELLYGHEDISIEESTPSITPPKEASIFQDGRGPFVHGLIDLFYEPGNEGLWTGNHPAIKQEGLAGNATAQNLFSSDNIDPVTLKRTSVISIAKDFEFRDPEQFFSRKPSNKHFSYDKEEELEDLDSSTQFPSVSEILERIYVGSDQKNLFPEEQSSGSSDNDRVPENKCSRLWERSGHSVHKDFLLAHLLGLVCSPRGLLPYAWPALASQLQRIDVIPQTIMDLVINQPQKFQMAFSEIFSDCITESLRGPSSAKSFWTGSEELLRTTDSIHTKGSSRYVSDFEELSVLGKGGFGYVVLCKNKIDGRHYAMKKIRLRDEDPSLNNKILREVTTLSRLQHRHIVRYYQAWFEMVASFKPVTSDLEISGEFDITGSSTNISAVKGSSTDPVEEKYMERAFLYIQMEYCPRTLRQVLDTNADALDEIMTWQIFRQIVEGLAHMHGQGIIHRDLTPNNIFFDVRNDVKIGDFGLAKFTSLEQHDREAFVSDVHGSSMDGTGQVGTYFYTAPEVGQGWPLIDDKADMYSLGVILFELWHPFETGMERVIVLSELKNKGVPIEWEHKNPQQAVLVKSLMSANPADRPSAMDVLRNHLPPRMEDEALNDVLRTIQKAENFYVLDRIISALFDEERISLIAHKMEGEHLTQCSAERSFFQNQVFKVAKDIFKSHGAQGFSTSTLSLVDQAQRGQKVRMIDSAGRMLELRSELRARFVSWIAANQVSSIKRYEIAQVYRKAAGPDAPHEYYQGDFDIVGDSFGLAEAEGMKVVVDIVSGCGFDDMYEIHINHASILEAIWSWSGVKIHERKDVAKLLSLGGCAPPQSSERKLRWVHIRQQLLQGLKLQESVVDRLQTVERRWNGHTDLALSRLRGGLADYPRVSAAIDELTALQSYLRVWDIYKHVYIDALMVPVEEYHKRVYFQVYLRKGSCVSTSSAGMLLAVGGRYDSLVQEHWPRTVAFSVPGAVGVSIALEKLILVTVAESEPDSSGIEVLVCSKGGGGLLRERMEIVSELWDGNIKADFVHLPSPSLTEQYDYANEHGYKWLVMITEADLEGGNNVKVRNMETRKVEAVSREDLVKFFTELAGSIGNKKSRNHTNTK